MHLITLPAEVRLQIYEELLCLPVNNFLHTTLVRWSSVADLEWRLRFLPSFPRLCSREGLPILYGNHRFHCVFLFGGVENLRALVGPENLSHIKHLIIGWCEMRLLPHLFQTTRLPASIKVLRRWKSNGYFRIDLALPANQLDLDLRGLFQDC
jgi:hypothetical protein